MTSKYIFDRIGALAGLLLLWPILLLIGIAIRFYMPGGPVLFRQQRVGKDGKLFTIYKFRTMHVVHDGTTVSVAGQQRIPPFGQALRRLKLDELPELWNVLVGEMSFVGPRPDVPGYADLLTGSDREILRLRPGITGPASMKYRCEEALLARQPDPQRYNDEVVWPDKVRINLYYLHHPSFLLDIKMIVYTLLRKEMTYNNEII